MPPQSAASIAETEDKRPQGLEVLKQLFGPRASENKDIRTRHGHGEGWHPPQLPDLVVFAETTAEVQETLRICHQYRIPLIPFGVGTSLEGHVCAPFGGVSLDFSQMNKVLSVNESDLDCRVEAGVTRKQLNHALRDRGLFFPIDPGADATLGGMAATRASGTNAVRYGTMRENVLGLSVVLSDGRLIKTGGRSRKSSNGYDLTRLFVGQEGTLGVITEVGLRLYGLPEATSAAVVQFDSLQGAVDTVIQVIQIGVPMARIELLDEVQMKACIGYSGLEGYQLLPTLFLEFHGTEASVKEQAEQVEAIAETEGGQKFRFATHAEDRNSLWQARHDAYYAALSLEPGKKGLATDVCVPISRLSEAILRARGLLEKLKITSPIVGHVGDGNFHTLMLIDPENPDDQQRAQEAVHQLTELALELEGTMSGEHGVGLGKMPYMEAEHGEEAVDVMRGLKQSLDPYGLLNPGKIIPQTV